MLNAITILWEATLKWLYWLSGAVIMFGLGILVYDKIQRMFEK